MIRMLSAKWFGLHFLKFELLIESGCIGCQQVGLFFLWNQCSKIWNRRIHLLSGAEVQWHKEYHRRWRIVTIVVGHSSFWFFVACGVFEELKDYRFCLSFCVLCSIPGWAQKGKKENCWQGKRIVSFIYGMTWIIQETCYIMQTDLTNILPPICLTVYLHDCLLSSLFVCLSFKCNLEGKERNRPFHTH